MKEQIKQLRLDLDSLARYSEDINERLMQGTEPSPGEKIIDDTDWSAQVESCTQCLLFSKAWLGKLLAEYGDEPSPYKDGKSAVSDIEPTDSKVSIAPGGNDKTIYTTIDPEPWAELPTHVSRVDLLRQVIGSIAEKVKQLTNLPGSREAAICRTQSWTYLTEARFYLGFEFERLKQKEDDKAI